ncbi:hypothetical protein [Helicobacter sp. T3_23-1059]
MRFFSQFFSHFFSGKTRKKLRLAWFIIRFWVIGKYHCNLPKWALSLFWLAHKVFWFFMFFCFLVTYFVLGETLGFLEQK